MKLFGSFFALAQAGTWEIPETWRYCEAREQVDPRSRYENLRIWALDDLFY